MSLLDSILLESHRDPHDIWIAARADAQRGSGTIDDPFDGGTRIDPSISGSASFDILEVLAAAAGTDHNYLTGDTVMISGMDGRDAIPFNGSFTVSAPTPRHFTFHLARVPKAPPAINPVPMAQRFVSGTLNHPTPLTAGMEVTINTPGIHRFPNGTLITINGVTGGGAPEFNGTFPIHGVADPSTSTSFKYFVSGTPAASANGQSVTCNDSISFHPYWPVGKVTTSSEHGYGDFDVVKVEEAAAPGTLPAILAGTFVIIGAGPTSTTFWYRLLNPNPPDVAIPAAVPGSYSVHCSCVRFHFDEVMRGLPENTPVMVHIGAGTFETRGSCVAYIKDANNGPNSVYAGFLVQQGASNATPSTNLFRPGLGMRIHGTGMEVTILKLVYAVDSLSQTLVLADPGETPTVNFEASDFTIDCNLFGQPVPVGFQYAPVSLGGIWLAGRLLRFQRIRTINFGPQSQLVESFASLLSAHYFDVEGPFHNVQEDCIFEKPAESNSRETTLLGVVGDAVSGNNRAGVVRHCFANMQYSNGALPRLLPVQNLHRDSSDRTLAWLTTTEPHSHTKAKGLVVRGALVGGSLSNAFNGTFAIESIISETQLTYRMYADPAPGSSGEFDATGAITIGHGISREQLAVKSLRVDSTEGYVLTDTFLDDGILGFMAAGIADADADVDPFCLIPVDLDAAFTVVTKRPHHRTQNHRVFLFNVGYTADVPLETPASPYNGAYPVLEVDSSGNPLFPDRLLARLPSDTPFVGRLAGSGAGMGADIHTIAAANGTGCFTEGNAIYDSQIPFHLDTGTSRDLIVRDNYWSDFFVGVNMNFATPGGADGARLAVSLTSDDTLATFETSAETRFTFMSPGQAVTIDNARAGGAPPGDPPSKYYNGTFTVLSVIETTADPKTYAFTYRMPQAPNADVVPSPDPTLMPRFRTRWQTLRCSLESNVMEGYPTDSTSYFSTYGVSTYGYPADFQGEVVQPAPYMFPQMIIRQNIFRHRDDISSIPDSSRAVGITSVEKGLIEGNVINPTNPHSLLYSVSGSIHTLGNRTPSGEVFHPYEGFSNSEIRDDLERYIEDTILFAL